MGRDATILVPDGVRLGRRFTYRGMPRTTTPVRNLIAANMSMRRDAFVALEGFKKGFGKVGARSRPEETELCIRALQRWPTARWLYEPRARVHHWVPAARGRWTYFLARCYNEGLGKAALASFLGAKDSLASERAYTCKTLPRAVARGVADALVRGDIRGLGRATAIVAGLATTAAGYTVGTVCSQLAHDTATIPHDGWQGENAAPYCTAAGVSSRPNRIGETNT